MKKPKHIGIAAITAEGGALAYREIVHFSERVLGRDTHPEISLHSHSFSDYTNTLVNKEETWGDLVVESSKKLAATAADFFICPANTSHVVFDSVQKSLPIPWLHIAAVVAEQAHMAGHKKCLLLGTRYLMQSSIYTGYFQDKSIALVVPEEREQDSVHRIIYEELIRGIFSDASKTELIKLIERCASTTQCDSVILGCTELPLLIDDSDLKLPILDSTRILAHGAVAAALGLSLTEIRRLISPA